MHPKPVKALKKMKGLSFRSRIGEEAGNEAARMEVILIYF